MQIRLSNQAKIFPVPKKAHILKKNAPPVYDNPGTQTILASAHKPDPRKAKPDRKPTG